MKRRRMEKEKKKVKKTARSTFSRSQPSNVR
jgi:hypothetical protein